MTTYRPSHRNGASKAGVSEAHRVPCKVSPENHGFHPEGELCPYCDPLAAAPTDELDEPLSDLEALNFQDYFWP